MQITKTLALSATELKFNEDSGSFKGYASVWGGVDDHQDTILKGAFLDTLRDDGLPKMFYQHQHGMPIGKYTHADEDSKGLWVEGELTQGHSLATDVRAALRHGTLDGLSIGGMMRKSDYKAGNNNGRIIHKWSRLIEVSPVVFPSDNAARVATVKFEEITDELEEIKTIRDLEYFLRDASGFSKGAAQALSARVKVLFDLQEADERDETKTEARALEILKKLSA